MADRVMSPGGQVLLDQVPLFMRGNHQFQALYNAVGNEVTLLDVAIDRMRDGLFPIVADGTFLALYESLLGISVASPLMTLAQRRTAVLGYLGRVTASGSATDWKRLGDALVGTGWTYQWNIPGDGTTPAPNHVTITLPFASTSIQAAQAMDLFTSITAATVIISFVFSNFFLLDSSVLDSPSKLLA